jgi:cytochrome P450
MRPLETRLAMRERYGRVFRTKDVIIGELVHVAERDLVEQVFKWKPAQFNVGEPRQVMEPVTGPSSILLLDGREHMRMRKLMLPPFHGEAIAHYADVIEEVTNREIDAWRPGDTIRTRTVAQKITMEVIIRAVFGITDAARVAQLQRALPQLSSPSPFLLLMQKDVGPRSPRKDILTLLLSARDEAGDALTDRELRDELITLLLAGHETTATSIGWAFERLLRTPAALERLSAELGADGPREYLDAVVKETLRVRPVVPEVFRAPSEPTELGGYQFEPGAHVAVALLLVQLDPELYPPDPQAFRPERFLDGAPEPYTWIPFGGGVRRCLGASFAQQEMAIVLQELVSRRMIRPTDPAPERNFRRAITETPRHNAEVVLS